MNSLRFGLKQVTYLRSQASHNARQRQISYFTGCLKKRLFPMTQFEHKCLQYSLPSSCHLRQYSTVTQVERETLWSRMMKEMGFVGKLKYNKQKLKLSGYNMYVCCQALVEFEQLFQDLDLPDTFNSWFLITELHVWLCMVRLAQLGKEGLIVRNSLVEAMWTDVDKRSKQLGDAASLTARREGVKELAQVFYASLFAYDEGLMGDDKVLAGAVWRTLFDMKDKEPEQLSLMVEYIRKQALHLDYLNPEDMLRNGLVTFLPLYGNGIDMDNVNKKLFVMFKKNMIS